MSNQPISFTMLFKTAMKKQIPTVSLGECSYNKESRVLRLDSNIAGMPPSIFIQSHKTGKDIRFIAIGPEDKLFDQDQWDGEQQIYRPTHPCNVDYLVIHNSY